MQRNNLIEYFTLYIESLCSKHVDIQHSEENKHFIRLDKIEMLESHKTISYPVVTVEKLTVSYSDTEDAMTKSRHIEMMFLNNIPDIGDADNIESVWSHMESIAEDFILKIKTDRRDRNKYPFLHNLQMSSMELDYVENIATHLYGVLLSFSCNLPFFDCIENRFSE